MRLRDIQRLELPASADMHVHLRQGDMMELVVPLIRQGGVDTVLVMPNLIPPITTAAQALEYQSRLQAVEPRVRYLMSLFLHPSITPQVIAEAAAAGIAGVKMYPQGVTTNSDSGVVSIQDYDGVFAAMAEHDLVLNLHGEVASAPEGAVSLEEAFLPVLRRIHSDHPSLRIVLEHCSTAAAVEAVRECGPTVAATITAHHLYLTGENSRIDPHAFCRPIPKTASDRDALIRAVCSGDPKFFFGSDSAPHPLAAKSGWPAAGVFTQPFATQLVLLALEEAAERGEGLAADPDHCGITMDQLEGFLSRFGRRFYRLPEPGPEEHPGTAPARIVCERRGERIPASVLGGGGGLEVGLSRAGAEVFSLRWLANPSA